MPTKFEQQLALRAELLKKMKRLSEIMEAAEDRDLSRRERGEADQLRRETDELRQRVPQIDGRLTQFNGISDDRSEEHGDLLAPTDRLADWVAERRGGRGSFAGDDFSRFSLGKIIRAAATGDRGKLNDVETRALAEGSDASGGFLLAPELSSEVIDLARSAAVAFTAGALTLPMGSPTVYLPRLSSGVEAAWKAENQPITGADEEWERITLTAKTVVVQQKISVELLEDISGTEAEAVIRNDLAKSLALKLDLAILEGSGDDPVPLGVYGTPDVNEVKMGGTNGGTPSLFDEVVKGDFAVRQANGAPATAAVMHPRDGESYALLKESSGQPIRRPDAIANLPFLTTTQIDIARTTGTSDDTSTVYVGDFATVVVGVRPSLQIRLLDLHERYADQLQVGLLAWLRADVALRHPQHMTKITGVRASA